MFLKPRSPPAGGSTVLETRITQYLAFSCRDYLYENIL